MLAAPTVTSVAKLSEAIGTALGPNDSLIVSYADRVEVYGDVSAMASKQASKNRTVLPTVFAYGNKTADAQNEMTQAGSSNAFSLTAPAKVHAVSGRFVAIANESMVIAWPAVRNATLANAHKYPIYMPPGATRIAHVFTSPALGDDIVLVTDTGLAAAFNLPSKGAEASKYVKWSSGVAIGQTTTKSKSSASATMTALVSADLVHARTRIKSVTKQKPMLGLTLAVSEGGESAYIAYRFALFDFVPETLASGSTVIASRCMRSLVIPTPNTSATANQSPVQLLSAASACALTTSMPRVPVVYVTAFWSNARWDLFTVPALSTFEHLVPVHSRQLHFAEGNLPSTAAVCFTAPRHVVLTGVAHPANVDKATSNALRRTPLPSTSPFQKQVQATAAASTLTPALATATSTTRGFEHGDVHALNAFSLVMDVAHGFSASAQLLVQSNFDVSKTLLDLARRETSKSKRPSAADTKDAQSPLGVYQQKKGIFLVPTTALTCGSNGIDQDDDAEDELVPEAASQAGQGMNAGFIVACPNQALHYSVQLSEPTLMGAVLRSKASADFMCTVPTVQPEASQAESKSTDVDAWTVMNNLTPATSTSGPLATSSSTTNAVDTATQTSPDAMRLLQLIPLQPAPKLIAMPSLPRVSITGETTSAMTEGAASKASKKRAQAAAETDATLTFWKDIFERWASFVSSSDESERKAIVSMFPITATVFGVELPSPKVAESTVSKKKGTKKATTSAETDVPPFSVSPSEFLHHFMSYVTAPTGAFDPNESYSPSNVALVNDAQVWEALIASVTSKGKRYRRVPRFALTADDASAQGTQADATGDADGTEDTEAAQDQEEKNDEAESDEQQDSSKLQASYDVMSLRKRRTLFGHTEQLYKRVQTRAITGSETYFHSHHAFVRTFSPLFVAVTAKHCAEQLAAVITSARAAFPGLTKTQLIERLNGADKSGHPFDERLLFLLPLRVLMASHSLSSRHVPGLLDVLAQLGQWKMIQDALYLIHDLGEADIVSLLQTLLDEWASQLPAHSTATMAELNAKHTDTHGNKVVAHETGVYHQDNAKLSVEIRSAVIPAALSAERARALLLWILDAPASQAFLKPELRAMDSTQLLCLLKLLLGWLQVLWFYNPDGVTKRFRSYRSDIVALGAKQGFVDLTSLDTDNPHHIESFDNTIRLTRKQDDTILDEDIEDESKSNKLGVPWYLQLLSTTTGIVPVSATTVPGLHKIIDWTSALIDANFAQIVLMVNASTSSSVSISTPGISSKRRISEAKEMRDVISQLMSIVSDHHLKFCKQAHSLKSFLNVFIQMQQDEAVTRPMSVLPSYSIQSLNI